MATIKSYTDISQSEALSKILPLESADMYRVFENNAETRVYYGKMPTAYFVCKPCWSLAALLNVLPDNYVDVNDTIYHPNLMKTKDGRYTVIYNVSQYTSLCNNPVDACVTMIERLHELNLL